VNRQHEKAFKALLDRALSYPGAWEDHPWGETVVKVAKKIFVFLGKGDSFGCSMKLDRTSEAALSTFPWCSPTGYGLGKAGWVTAQFEPKQDVPVPLLLEWLDESYQAVAPAKIAKEQGKAKGKPKAKARSGARK
jgi:predicted DNA-binding protein (MmcQ/YjbR family)